MAKYSVSLTLTVQAEDEEEAAAEFYKLVSMGAYDSDSLDIEEEVDDEASEGAGVPDAEQRGSSVQRSVQGKVQEGRQEGDD